MLVCGSAFITSTLVPRTQRHIYIIMDLATGGELFNLVTKNPGDCATESEIRRMITHMLSAVRKTKGKLQAGVWLNTTGTGSGGRYDGLPINSLPRVALVGCTYFPSLYCSLCC